MKDSFSKKLERKLGKYAISNISLYLIICYGFGYLISTINPVFLGYLTLEPQFILQGQVWRLFTWILVPPSGMSLFSILITMLLYYSLGSSLERTWGTYRYNHYLFSGMIYTILAVFILYAYFRISGQGVLLGIGSLISTYYINMSIFLAYAATFPENEIYLYFILRIKVKYLGIAYGVLLFIEFIGSSTIIKIIIASSLFNFLVFFITLRNAIHLSPKQVKRRQVYKAQMESTKKTVKHKCAICGRTEETNPELEFRYCSKCDGNYEYCQDHLFTHEHVKK
ncbi:MAG: hypothetical protein ACRC7V_07115 [Lachnospiraceae bacterium]